MQNLFKKIRAYIRLQKAIRKADELFAYTRERQYVLVYGDKLLVISRSNMKMLKKKKLIPWGVNVQTLERICIYHTAYGNGTKDITASEKKMREALYYKAVLS